jgi:putative transposase
MTRPPVLLAHKVRLYQTPEQAEYFWQCMGARRYTYNKLLEHFQKPGVKWSKKAAYAHFIKHVRQPWMDELTSRAPRNAIDDLDNAYQHFFRRCKLGEKPGYPQCHVKGVNDSFAIREFQKFEVFERSLRIEKCPGRIKLQQEFRFVTDFKGVPNSVTIKERAGKFYAAIVVDTRDYDKRGGSGAVGADFGINSLVALSTGEKLLANKKLKSNLKRLKRRSRILSRKKKQLKSKRRARAKLALAKLHKRIADQRAAILHEVSNMLTRRFGAIAIENLAVKNMVKNRRLARSIHDAGWGNLRRMIEYKAKARGCTVVIAPRFYPSSKMCSCCKTINKTLKLSDRIFHCNSCGYEQDRDINAAINLLNYLLDYLPNLLRQDTLRPDVKCTQELRKTSDLSEDLSEDLSDAAALTACTDLMKGPHCEVL